MKHVIRRQKPVKGGRNPLSGGITSDIERAVIHTANKFLVSKSFVQTVALARYFGIELEDTYEEQSAYRRAQFRRIK